MCMYTSELCSIIVSTSFPSHKTIKNYFFVVHLFNDVHVVNMSISHHNDLSWYLYSTVGKT